MKNKKYTYSILKYQHSALLGESLNIGVLIYFPFIDKFIFKYSKNLSRVKAIYDIVSEKTIKHYLIQIDNCIEKLNRNELLDFDIEKFEYFDLFIDKFILPRDGSVLQFSKSKQSLLNNDNIDFTISYLINKFLLEKERQNSVASITKEPLLTRKFYGYLSNLDFEKININSDKFYKNYKVVNETGNEFNFDYAWQNGTLNLVKPLSFDLKEPKSIAEKAYKNFGLFTDLKNEAETNNLKYDLLIGKPESKELFREFDHALNLLNTLDKVDIILEDDIEKYSKKAIKALTFEL
ncbi:DUF3037 domain-containing protein [Flavobacterium sp. J27]|uniref:DUF3037 domain-containing protein n=1 Tax=Flavobacterium sp. J27 TaxID=2060419 RepID=UPI0010310001|nr:DUF3037 domain-containing protein [Flavobacterium sp. J27]